MAVKLRPSNETVLEGLLESGRQNGRVTFTQLLDALGENNFTPDDYAAFGGTLRAEGIELVFDMDKPYCAVAGKVLREQTRDTDYCVIYDEMNYTFEQAAEYCENTDILPAERVRELIRLIKKRELDEDEKYMDDEKIRELMNGFSPVYAALLSMYIGRGMSSYEIMQEIECRYIRGVIEYDPECGVDFYPWFFLFLRERIIKALGELHRTHCFSIIPAGVLKMILRSMNRIRGEGRTPCGAEVGEELNLPCHVAANYIKALEEKEFETDLDGNLTELHYVSVDPHWRYRLKLGVKR